MGFEDLAPEIRKKAKACKTIDELIELAKTEGFELSREMLEGMSGGICRRDCLFYGAICVNDVDCITKGSCSIFEPCETLSLCDSFLDTIPEPTPIPQIEPILCPIVEIPS